MSRNLPGRATQVALVVASLAMNACLGSEEGDGAFEADGTNIAAEPTSLSELGGVGGATYLDSSAEEIASLAHVAIEAEVLDVQKSHLNTADRLFPTGAEIDANGLSNLEVLTDVVVRVVRTVAATGPEYDYAAGTLLTITVGGGSFETMLDLEQATAIGMTEVVDNDFPEHVEGDGLLPDDEAERPVAGAAFFRYGRSPGVILAEGDRIVVFLLEHNIRVFRGDVPMLTLLSPVHPQGVFRDAGDGIWRDTRGDEADLGALAVLVEQPR